MLVAFAFRFALLCFSPFCWTCLLNGNLLHCWLLPSVSSNVRNHVVPWPIVCHGLFIFFLMLFFSFVLLKPGRGVGIWTAVWCIHRLFEIQYSSLHYALWVQTQVNTLLMQAVHMHWIIHWMAPRYYTAWRIWSNAAWWPLPGSTWMLCWEWQLHKHVSRQLQSSNSWRLE